MGHALYPSSKVPQPQGSVLGPLFYNIYVIVNNIQNCTNKFDIVSYADDTTLIATIDSFISPNTNKFENINSELETSING